MEVNPGYKQTQVGVIPEDWETADLASITDPNRPISYGIVQTGPNVAGGVRCLRVLDIEAGRINGADLITTSERISASYKRTILVANDLVMPLRGNVGDVGMIDKDLVGCNLTRGVALIAIRPQSSPRYCKQAISSNASRSRLEQSMNGSALQEIPIGMLRRFKLALPATKTEQEDIAEALGDADALIGSLEQLLTKKRQIKKGAMQELLAGKKRLPGFSGEWEVKRLGEFVSIRNQKALPSGLDVDTLCIELDHIGQGDGRLFEYSAAQYSTSSKYRFCSGDVLFGRLRSYLRKFWLADRDGICSTEIWPLMVDPEQARSDFLYAIVQSDEFIATANISYGTHMPRADWDIVRNFSVSLPNPKEQTAIATILSDMDAEITALEAKLSKARQLKQSMMQELLTGRIRLL